MTLRCRSLPVRRFALLIYLVALGMVVSGGGCKPAEQIHKYTVTRIEGLSPEPADDKSKVRLLAVMAPAGKAKMWFFKLMGTPEQVTPETVTAFDQFIASVHISDDNLHKGKPMTWTLPAGWTEGPTKSGRLATLYVSPDHKLELAITMFGGSELENVNRWRVQQVGLPGIKEAQLDEVAPPIKVDGRSGRRVDFSGPGVSGGGGMMPPVRSKE